MIAISLLTLVPGQLGGSETYVRELLRGLGRLGGDSYRVVVPPVAPDAGEGLPTEVAQRYRRADTRVERGLATVDGTLRPGRLRPAFAGADVVHFPLTIEVPRLTVPRVVTLHDVQHLDLPLMFSRAERAYRSVFWHRSIRRADRVIVMSNFVRGRAVAKLGLEPSVMRVVPLGLDHAVLTPGGEREPFLYYPARSWPHKNHPRLFEAFALIRRDRPDLRLVLTGNDIPDTPDGVESLGHVPWGEVVSLMQRASALVFPSLYEGFGLPPLEAMACGCPVACSNAAALPETVGDAARLFDPFDPKAIAAAVLDVLDAPEEWTRRGLERAARYTWDETVRETDAVYAELR
jgi:glycosyltransferase involved in cell wall biosynthesis